MKPILVSSITLGVILALNMPFGIIPPIGKFLDPFNGFWQNSESQSFILPEQISHPSIQGKGTVLFDSLLVPHIYAENDHDLYFLQGYVTASQRLWQMEFQTHAAAGRISEIIGKKALEFDRQQRRKGLKEGAEKFIKKLMTDQKMKTVVEGYTAGINAYIQTLSYKDYPFEYKLLGYSPEAWTPIKCAYLLKYMSDDLSGSDEDFEYSNALALFGEEYMDILYPYMLPIQDPVVNGTTNWDFEAKKLSIPENYKPVPTQKNFLLPKPHPDNGSNNWAVSGEKTKNGHPILCNDPHLSLSLPSIWYMVHLSSPTTNVMGVSLPGSPNVIIGFNDQISWGVTNARRDVRDWYKITFKDGNREEYLLDGKWVKSRKVIEEIKIKDKASFFDTLYYTHWGPIVYDQNFNQNANKTNYALKWVAHDESEELKAFYMLNRAKNYDDYRKALTYYSCPAQNFVFAANNGDIAITIQGKFPLKWEEQGKYIMDGSLSSMGWKGFIPMEHNVYTKNPDRGFVSSANQHPVDSTYPYYNFDPHYEYYRNRRINQRLDEMQAITKEDMQELLNDNYNLMAAENLPFLLSQLPNEKLDEKDKKNIQLLKQWDYYNHAEIKAPIIYKIWVDSLIDIMWDEMRREDLLLRRPNKTVSLQLLQTNPDLKFMDIVETSEKESAKDLIYLSFKKASKKYTNWADSHTEEQNWGAYKNTKIRHLARLKPLSKKGLRNGGYKHIVNATRENHGPSWRMVVELDPKGTKAWGVYPGGQSGNPGSHYYTQQVSNWESCQLYPLQFMKGDSILTTTVDNKTFILKQEFSNK